MEVDLRCRCLGVNKVDLMPSCEDEATEEDGLCDGCRCPHGCCENHTMNELCEFKGPQEVEGGLQQSQEVQSRGSSSGEESG
jgi:hypothetical protein